MYDSTDEKKGEKFQVKKGTMVSTTTILREKCGKEASRDLTRLD